LFSIPNILVYITKTSFFFFSSAFIAALYIDKDLEFVHTFMNVCFFPRLKVWQTYLEMNKESGYLMFFTHITRLHLFVAQPYDLKSFVSIFQSYKKNVDSNSRHLAHFISDSSLAGRKEK